MKNEPKHIVVIGGGTGTYTVLSGLRMFPSHKISLTAVVSSADSGGSTGQLRDAFGYLPVGDIRMALLGLAEGISDPVLRDLFTHRFDKGEGLKGHNVGNLMLVALTDLYGSEEEAVKAATKILRLRGTVLPVTDASVTLAAAYDDGTVKKGETHIDEAHEKDEAHIERIWVEPEVHTTQRVRDAIAHADLVVLSPGDLYTSVLANLVVPGVADALARTPARMISVLNLMTKYGQTHGYTARTHYRELTRYIGRAPDRMLVNTTPLPDDVLARYEKEGESPVHDDLGEEVEAVRTDLLAEERVERESGDSLKRSLIRHDPEKLARAIMELA